MPESVTDRCTKSHEYIFLLTKNAQYFYNHEAIKEPSVDAESYTGRKFRGRRAIYESGCIPTNPQTMHKGNEADGKTYERRNKRDVWTVQLRPFRDAHFATFPPDLIEPCILAGSRQGDTILDPFNGAGTTGLVSLKHGRHYIGCELNPKYIDITTRRLNKYAPLFTGEQP
jgi:DNA modification methylase